MIDTAPRICFYAAAGQEMKCLLAGYVKRFDLLQAEQAVVVGLFSPCSGL